MFEGFDRSKIKSEVIVIFALNNYKFKRSHRYSYYLDWKKKKIKEKNPNKSEDEIKQK